MKTPKDIQKLGDRIKQFKKRARLEEKNTQKDSSDYSRSAMGWQISVELLAAVLIGAGIGYVLDGVLSTQPWFLALFTILGGAAGFLNIYRTFKDEDRTNKE